MDLISHLRVPGATPDDRVADATFAGLCIALGLVPYLALAWVFDGRQTPTTLLWTAVTSLGAFLSVRFRRTHPLVFMAVTTVCLFVQVLAVPTPTVAIVVVPYVAYTVARWVEGLRARSVILIGAVGSILAPWRWIIQPFQPEPIVVAAAFLASAVCFGLVITPYAIGRRTREVDEARQAMRHAEQIRYEILLSEREHETRAIEAKTRNQIARELHDVVAHSLSVIVVQAEGARALATKRPEAASEALGTIAGTGREALTEMRRIVAVLRDEDSEAASYAPLPGLADLPDLVARTGAHLDVTGDVPDASATLGLAAYRIVQEALTNVLKHAGDEADPQVTIRYEPTGISVDVVDSGIGQAAVDDGRGHGLRGMAERVASQGGRLHTVARPEGGYRVSAWLPVGGKEKARS